LDRSRMREAFWISVIVHLAVAIVLFTSPIWQKWFPTRPVLLVSPATTHDKELTYLALPPDAQKLTRKPNSNIISDKDRIAMSRKPHLDAKELRKILDSSRPGPAGAPSTPGPAAQPAPAPPQNAAPVQPQRAPAQTNQV